MLCRLFIIYFMLLLLETSRVVISLIIGEMQFIFNNKDNVINIIRKTLIMFFVLIMIFIFIEIIELSFRGLSKDIKKNK